MEKLKPVLVPCVVTNHLSLGLKNNQLLQFNTGGEARGFKSKYNVYDICLMNESNGTIMAITNVSTVKSKRMPMLDDELLTHLIITHNIKGKLPDFVNVVLINNNYSLRIPIEPPEIKLKEGAKKKVAIENKEAFKLEKPKLIVEKNTKTYSQCNFCMSNENLYDIRGEGLFAVTTMCHDCIKKVAGMVDKLI